MDEGDAIQPPRDAPTTGHVDELLVDPPAAPRGGSIEGYRAGRWTRVMFALIVLATVAAGVVLFRWVREQRAQERDAPVIPSYALAEGEDGYARPRQLVWSAGPARLGLAREPPGVEEIVLPDRRIRLATGCDHAQIKVNVVGDRTVSLRVVVGDIVELPPVDNPGSQPAPAAKEP